MVVPIPLEVGEALLLTLEAWQALKVRLDELLGNHHRQVPLPARDAARGSAQPFAGVAAHDTGYSTHV